MRPQAQPPVLIHIILALIALGIFFVLIGYTNYSAKREKIRQEDQISLERAASVLKTDKDWQSIRAKVYCDIFKVGQSQKAAEEQIARLGEYRRDNVGRREIESDYGFDYVIFGDRSMPSGLVNTLSVIRVEYNPQGHIVRASWLRVISSQDIHEYVPIQCPWNDQQRAKQY